MPIYDGVVTLAEADIPVIVELDNGHVRLSASGREIGQWPLKECEIVHLEDSTYTINAENETLHFVPNQPSLFQAAVNDGRRHLETRETAPTPPSPEPEKESPNEESDDDAIAEAPPPRPMTVALFYALCVLTAAMGVWAIISIIL